MNYELVLPNGEAIGLYVDQAVYDLCPFAEPFLAAHQCNQSLLPRLHLGVKQSRLFLHWHQQENLSLNRRAPKPISFTLDFAAQLNAVKSFPVPKQGAFNQALGKKTKVVLDATGGWGGDAVLMASQGYQVQVQERLPLMALLLSEAFFNLDKYINTQGWAITAPSVVLADSITATPANIRVVDCAYLDPMFPPKRKKSAASNKQMQLLHWLLGEDQDAESLLKSILEAKIPRVAVKRPDYAAPLLKQPNERFSSKLVHYDVYLN